MKKAHPCTALSCLRNHAWRVWPVCEFPKRGINKNNYGYISTMYPEAPRGRMCTWFGTAIGVADIITCDRSFGDRLRGVDSVWGLKLPFPIDKASRLNTGLALPRSLSYFVVRKECSRSWTADVFTDGLRAICLETGLKLIADRQGWGPWGLASSSKTPRGQILVALTLDSKWPVFDLDLSLEQVWPWPWFEALFWR